MVSNFSSLECSNSSDCNQDVTTNKPAKKVKLRSVLPTLSSLLLGVDDSELSKHVPAYKMEEKLRIIDGKRIYPDEFSSGCSHFGESKRTEDIFIREDEDGIRSHYCPLVSNLDRITHDKYCSDSETENEFDNTSSFYWKEFYSCQPSVSELKTPSSESEDSSNESVRYAPLENQRTTKEDSPAVSPNRILQLLQLTERTPLDKKTMESWLEDSSDDFDDFSIKDSGLPPRNTIGNESDMEEFEKDSESETENEGFETTEDKNRGDKKDEGSKDFVIESRNDTESKSSTESSNKLFKSEHSERKSTDENENSSNINNTGDNKSHKERSDKISITQDFIEEQKTEWVAEAEKTSYSGEHDVPDDLPSKNQLEMSTKPKNEENKIKDLFERNISEFRKKGQTQPHQSSNSPGKDVSRENRPTTNENSPVSSPNHRLSQLTERTSYLDKATTELSLENSSNKFGDLSMNNLELIPRDNIGNESNTEEFSKTEIKTGSPKITEDTNEGDKKDEGNKDLLLLNAKSLRNDPENESSTGFSDRLAKSKLPERKDSGENEHPSNINNPDNNESQSEKFNKQSKTISTALDFNDEQKREGVSKADDTEHDVLDDLSLKRQIEMSTKPKNEEKKIKDPFESNISESKRKSQTQADNGDKLYYEMSTEREVTYEKHSMEREIVSDELRPTKSVLKPINRSDVFEPLLIEEQSVPSKARNRLAKFVQSFKKKFEKNKKA